MAPSVPSSPGVSTTLAPYSFSSCLRSGLAVFGTHTSTSYPSAAPSMAYAMPVFPEVASNMVLPGTSSPRRSPSRSICSAARSFTEPPGLNHSALAYISTAGFTPYFSGSRDNLSSGVLPISLVMSPRPWTMFGMYDVARKALKVYLQGKSKDRPPGRPPTRMQPTIPSASLPCDLSQLSCQEAGPLREKLAACTRGAASRKHKQQHPSCGLLPTPSAVLVISLNILANTKLFSRI